MNAQRSSASIGAIALGVLAISATPVRAFNFNSGTGLGDCANIPLESLGADGISNSTVRSCTTADGMTLTAEPDDAVLTLKEVNGVRGVGIFHDLHPNGSIQEIDYGETLTLSFTESIVSSLDISFLYKAEETDEFVFGDVINEVARITAGQETGRLTVLDATTAEWSWNGITQTLNTLSSSDGDGGGWYRILNPFGDTTATTVTLTSPLQVGQDYTYSDFAVSGATLDPVPEPSLLVGLGTIAAAVMGLRRQYYR